MLTRYDPAGGYGHPDHVQVHRVGARAAELAGTPVRAGGDRRPDLLRRARAAGVAGCTGSGRSSTAAAFERAYTPRGELTHRVDVRALRRAQAGGDGGARQPGHRGPGDRTLAALLRLPRPAVPAGAGAGVVHRARAGAAGGRLLDDVFATLRERPDL